MAKAFKVNVVTGQGGGGHYSTYRAIKAVVEQRRLPWELQVTDMDDIIAGLSQAGEIQNAYETFGFSGHDLYNLMVKGGWTWLWPLKMRLNKLMVKMNHQTGVKIFAEHWQKHQPDLVVSVMPLYNKGLYESLQIAKPGTPYVTVLTDFADCPPAFWFDPEAGNTLVCGTDRAVEQARSLQIPSDRIIQSSGLVIHPNFYKQQPLSDTERDIEKAAKRIALGLDASTPTGLVMFGGNGSKVMLDIAKRLEGLEEQIQLIFVCGNNTEVAEALKTNSSRVCHSSASHSSETGTQKRAVVGFVDEIANYMQLSDFFIGKPGNVSVSEALAMKLPIITECALTTMSQEKYCAQWVKNNGVGIVVSSFKQIEQAVSEMIQPARYQQYKQRLAEFDNQAVFEVADLLQIILESTSTKPFAATASVTETLKTNAQADVQINAHTDAQSAGAVSTSA